MNYLALGAKSLKKAQKAQINLAERLKIAEDAGMGFPYPERMLENEKKRVLEEEFAFLSEAMEIGLSYYQMAKTRLAGEKSERVYMVTVRPRASTDFFKFYNCVCEYVQKWIEKYSWYKYVFEQKGEDIDTMGTGFHVHFLFGTNTVNFYPSHILREAVKSFNWCCERQCIQVDSIKNLKRAIEYIKGEKHDVLKSKAVAFDSEWRAANGLEEIYEYEADGQVQAVCSTEK